MLNNLRNIFLLKYFCITKKILSYSKIFYPLLDINPTMDKKYDQQLLDEFCFKNVLLYFNLINCCFLFTI